MRVLILLITAVLSLNAFASDKVIELNTRSGVKVPVYYMKQNNATATVVLLPGGAGGLGKIVDGQPTSKNFLVRARDYFSRAGLNVAVMGRASDKEDLDYSDRVSKEHMQDIKKLVEYLKKDAKSPVWLVGTSRGTVSATAAAIDFGNKLGGIVLTSSVVSYKKTGAVPSQDLASIRIPVLVVHHENDSCEICSPNEVPSIINKLKNSPAKKLYVVKEGDNPSGNPCGGMHYHGFIGAEKSTAKLITDWIKKPVN